MALGVAAEKGTHLAMRSPINWALLGLVIQRPSYGYELVQRFERCYGEAIELSSPSQIYTALDSLARRELIETMRPDDEPGGGRQPKPHYRATATGAREYERWLVVQLQQERQRSRMFAQQLSALAPAAAASVLERCERALLAQASAPAPGMADEDDAGADGRTGLGDRLIAEEDRLGIGARLQWIEYARRELGALARRRPDA